MHVPKNIYHIAEACGDGKERFQTDYVQIFRHGDDDPIAFAGHGKAVSYCTWKEDHGKYARFKDSGHVPAIEGSFSISKDTAREARRNADENHGTIIDEHNFITSVDSEGSTSLACEPPERRLIPSQIVMDQIQNYSIIDSSDLHVVGIGKSEHDCEQLCFSAIVDSKLLQEHIEVVRRTSGQSNVQIVVPASKGRLPIILRSFNDGVELNEASSLSVVMPKITEKDMRGDLDLSMFKGRKGESIPQGELSEIQITDRGLSAPTLEMGGRKFLVVGSSSESWTLYDPISHETVDYALPASIVRKSSEPAKQEPTEQIKEVKPKKESKPRKTKASKEPDPQTADECLAKADELFDQGHARKGWKYVTQAIEISGGTIQTREYTIKFRLSCMMKDIQDAHQFAAQENFPEVIKRVKWAKSQYQKLYEMGAANEEIRSQIEEVEKLALQTQ